MVVALSLLTFTLYAAYTKDSAMFATLFVCVLLVSAAFYLFQFGTLQKFSISALSANAEFVREKATEAKETIELIKVQKLTAEQTAKEILEMKAALGMRIQEVEEIANHAQNTANYHAGIV